MLNLASYQEKQPAIIPTIYNIRNDPDVFTKYKQFIEGRYRSCQSLLIPSYTPVAMQRRA